MAKQVTCFGSWCSEFDFWDQHSGREEPTPASCPLAYHIPSHILKYALTYMHKHNTYFKKKSVIV